MSKGYHNIEKQIKHSTNLSTKYGAMKPATACAGANFPSFFSKPGAVAYNKHKP